MWTVIVAVDPNANTSLLEWVRDQGRDAVQEVLEVAHASQIPNVLTLRSDQPIALWLSTICPDLPQWAQVIMTLIQHRTAPTRIVLLAEGTPDGVAGSLGSLAATPLATAATVFEGQTQPDTGELIYDYAAIGDALWGSAAPVVPPASGPSVEVTRAMPGSASAPASAPDIPDHAASAPSPSSRPVKRRWWGRAKTPPSAPGAEALDAYEPRVVRAVLPASRLIVVVGGKGGVGKTTVAASLLRQAAQRYGSAMGIDFDYLKPNLALHFWPIDARMPNIDELFDSIEIARTAIRERGIDEDTERRMVGEWIERLRPPNPGCL